MRRDGYMKKLDDSAQMLLLAAFAIAFMIVVLTIMLNNLIYASNIASESGDDISSFDVSNIVQLTDEATSAAYYNATTGGSFDNSVFTQYLNTYEHEIQSLYAYRGITFSFSNSTLDEAYFTQNGLSSGTSDWIVINNVEVVNNFTVEMPDTGKLQNASSPFEIHAVNQSGSSIWSMKVYDDGININISVINQTNTIASSNNSVYLDIINNNPVNFNFAASTASETYQIKYLNGSNAVGLYLITGSLATNDTFESERYKVINTTVNIAIGKNKVNVSVPVTVP